MQPEGCRVLLLTLQEASTNVVFMVTLSVSGTRPSLCECPQSKILKEHSMRS